MKMFQCLAGFRQKPTKDKNLGRTHTVKPTSRLFVVLGLVPVPQTGNRRHPEVLKIDEDDNIICII